MFIVTSAIFAMLSQSILIARAPSELIRLNDTDEPHLGFPPKHPNCEHLSPVLGFASLSEVCWKSFGLLYVISVHPVEPELKLWTAF